MSTLRVGLIGFPIKHSLSPVFQQAAFDALGVDAQYELWETPPEQIADAVARLRNPDCLGANVTMPHKQGLMKIVDRVDDVAAAVGAINTIVRQTDGSLVGFNTDVDGFDQAIRVDGETDLERKRVVLLGSGGAARAVVVASLDRRVAELVICARRPSQARALLDDVMQHRRVDGRSVVRILPWEDDRAKQSAISTCDVVVNATPVGMSGHHAPDGLLIQPAWLSARTLVCDLVYSPPLTPFLAAAQERGARILNGLPMVVYQGATAFERWTGRAAPVELMRQKALEALHG